MPPAQSSLRLATATFHHVYRRQTRSFCCTQNRGGYGGAPVEAAAKSHRPDLKPSSDQEHIHYHLLNTDVHTVRMKRMSKCERSDGPARLGLPKRSPKIGYCCFLRTLGSAASVLPRGCLVNGLAMTGSGTCCGTLPAVSHRSSETAVQIPQKDDKIKHSLPFMIHEGFSPRATAVGYG